MNGFKLIWLALALLAAAYGDSPPELETASATLAEYIELGTDDQRILRGIYADSLKAEMDRRAERITALLAEAPELREAFIQAHDAFLTFAVAQAGYTEAFCWTDPQTGETFYGSGTGEPTLSVLNSMYWQRCLYYQRVIQAIETGDVFIEIFDTLPDSAIGGE